MLTYSAVAVRAARHHPGVRVVHLHPPPLSLVRARMRQHDRASSSVRCLDGAIEVPHHPAAQGSGHAACRRHQAYSRYLAGAHGRCAHLPRLLRSAEGDVHPAAGERRVRHPGEQPRHEPQVRRRVEPGCALAVPGSRTRSRRSRGSSAGKLSPHPNRV